MNGLNVVVPMQTGKKMIKNRYGSEKYKVWSAHFNQLATISKMHGLWHQMDLTLNFSFAPYNLHGLVHTAYLSESISCFRRW